MSELVQVSKVHPTTIDLFKITFWLPQQQISMMSLQAIVATLN